MENHVKIVTKSMLKNKNVDIDKIIKNIKCIKSMEENFTSLLIKSL